MVAKRFSDYRALSFDCYGTLIDWESGILDHLGPWSDAKGLGLSPDELIGAFSRHERVEQRVHPAMPYPEILANVLRRIAAEHGVEASDREAAAFGASVGDWPAFPDSHEALSHLGRHYRLLILSNVDRSSFAKSRARLDVEFDAIVTAQDVGSYKPAPENFRRVIEVAEGLVGERGLLLHVGESMYHDIVPGRAAALPTVWIDRGRDRGGARASGVPEGAEPDHTFGSMAEFVEAVRGERGE